MRWKPRKSQGLRVDAGVCAPICCAGLGRRDAARDAYLAATSATQLEPLRRLRAQVGGAGSGDGRLRSTRRDGAGVGRQADQQRLQRGQRRMIDDAVDAAGPK